jgi:hypothetical protein
MEKTCFENRPEPDSKILHQNDLDTDFDSNAKDSDGSILDILRYLRDYSASNSETLLTLADLSLDSLYLEVSDLPPEIIKSKIEDIAVEQGNLGYGLLNFKCTFQNWISLF